MNTRKITLLIVAALALMAVAGTKISQLTRTRSLQETSRFLVSTQDATTGRWSSRYITAPDLATNLGPWITNSGGGGGSYTLPSYVLTNGETKGVRFTGRVTNDNVIQLNEDITQADGYNADFSLLSAKTVDINGTNVVQQIGNLVGSTNGLNTKITVTSNDLYSSIVAAGISANTATNIARYFATNSALVTSNQLINLLAAKTNPTLYGTMTLPGVTASEVAAFDASKGLTTVSGISATELGFVDNLTENVQDAINELRSSQARVGDWVASITNTILLNTSSNYVAVMSNAANNTRIRLAAGTYTVTPSKVLSNGLGAINIFNKTNLIIEAEEGAIIDGSSAIGELLWATNCDGLVIRGLTFKGAVVTNYVLVSNIGHVWGGVSYHNVRNFSFERNRVIDHHDHGTLDMGSQGGNWSPSTNNVWIERNYFSNIGSKRTNDPVVIDGAAIVPSGGVIQFNEIEDSLRGIEPYIDLNTTRLSPGLIVRGNVIRNTLEHGILVAGSTNMHDLIIEDNRITWDLGYTRRGSNVITSADGININGGQRATIRNNTILNAPNFDINTTSDLEKFGFIIEGNKGRGSFYTGSGGGGIELSASSAQYPSRGFVVRNNTIENKRSYGLSANGLRDARFNGNTLFNVGTNGTMAVWVYAGGGQLNSNVIFEATSITGDERAAKAANGFQIESGNKEISIAGSQIKGITTPISNSAGAEVVTLEYSRTSTNAVVVNWELVRASNALYSAIGSGSGSGSTSNSIPVVTITTNITVGFGTFQSVTMLSASNQFLNLTGAATNGDAFEIAVTNTAATNISISLNTNGGAAVFYNPTVGTNDSAFGVAPGGRILEFVYSTNWGGIWRLNNYLGSERELVPGYGTTWATNGNWITNGLSTVLQGLHANAASTVTNTARGFGVSSAVSAGVLTATATNAITYAATNTTSLHVDWTGTEIVMVPLLLTTNLVLIPTNMVIGRPLTVIARASGVTYNLSISNAAGTRILYPVGSTNSGNAALTVTNGQQIELNLLPLTNGISAAFGRFQ